MADTVKGKLAETGHKIAETATKVGHKIAEGAEKAADWAKEKLHQAGHKADEAAQKAEHKAKESCGTAKTTTQIGDHMDVIASCGKKVGVVDHVESGTIKLTKGDSPDGQHHFIPVAWVDHVDSHVHLKKNSQETEQSWKSDAASCGCS